MGEQSHLEQLYQILYSIKFVAEFLFGSYRHMMNYTKYMYSARFREETMLLNLFYTVHITWIQPDMG